MHKDSTLPVMIFILVGIILFVAFAFWFWPKYGQRVPAAASQANNQAQTSSSAPEPSHAPSGQLVSRFPKDLIIGSSAKVSDSYSINYNSSLNQYTASFSSSESVENLFSAYENYFSKNGWTVTNKIASSTNFRGIYATKGTSDANVGMISQNGMTNATVSYVAR